MVESKIHSGQPKWMLHCLFLIYKTYIKSKLIGMRLNLNMNTIAFASLILLVKTKQQQKNCSEVVEPHVLVRRGHGKKFG